MNGRTEVKIEEELMRNDTKRSNIAGASTLDTSGACSFGT